MHQLSFTVPYGALGGGRGVGDTFLHYRFQALEGSDGRTAFSPRVSLVIPTGSSSRGLGFGHPGWQVNLPFSKQVRDFYFHWNAGLTHFPSAAIDGETYSLLSPQRGRERNLASQADAQPDAGRGGRIGATGSGRRG